MANRIWQAHHQEFGMTKLSMKANGERILRPAFIRQNVDYVPAEIFDIRQNLPLTVISRKWKLEATQQSNVVWPSAFHFLISSFCGVSVVMALPPMA